MRAIEMASNLSMMRSEEERSMIDDLGILRISIDVAPVDAPERRVRMDNVMVDTGAEYSWAPSRLLADIGVAPVRVERFQTAEGRLLERAVGFVMLYAGGRSSPSIVVFGHEGDMTLLGAFGLEGLNLRVDLGRRELVPAGPLPAAAVAA
jgi:predicted aspartyl protease